MQPRPRMATMRKVLRAVRLMERLKHHEGVMANRCQDGLFLKVYSEPI